MALAICGSAWLLVRCNPGVPNLSGTPNDAGGNDATTTDAGSDATATDAGNDATATDAADSDAPSPDAVADSGGDAPVTDAVADGNDAATGYCASLSPAPGFCADFDTGKFDSQFSFDHTAGTGSISADAKVSVSPPNSFYAKLGISSPSDDFAFMTRVISDSASQVTYAFDLRLDARPGGPPAGVLAAIVFNDGKANRHTLSFYVTGTSAALEESFTTTDGGTAFLDHKLLWVPKLGQWTRVAFSMDVNAGTCTATIDGKPDLTNGSLASSWSTGAVTLDLGLSYVSSQSAAWAAHYDNVVASWK